MLKLRDLETQVQNLSEVKNDYHQVKLRGWCMKRCLDKTLYLVLKYRPYS